MSALVETVGTVVQTGRKYVAPIVAGLPFVGTWLQGQFLRSIKWGADAANATEMGSAIAKGADVVGRVGAQAVSKANVAAAAAADLTLLYGLTKEGQAMWKGNCRF